MSVEFLTGYQGGIITEVGVTNVFVLSLVGERENSLEIYLQVADFCGWWRDNYRCFGALYFLLRTAAHTEKLNTFSCPVTVMDSVSQMVTFVIS